MTAEPLDLIGVGVGPSNLSTAALASQIPNLDAAFLEAQPSFTWHRGMMLPGTRLQTSPLKDLATPVDPTNPYTFLNYLAKKGRFYAFLHADRPAVPRREFEDYLAWAAEHLDSVRFDHPVTRVRVDGDAFAVHVDGRREPLRARAIVLGTGQTPTVPDCATPHLGERVFHGSEIAHRDPDLDGQRVAVVGGGQSGAEVVQAALDEHWGTPARLDWLSRRRNFRPLDEVAFTNQFFTPDYVEAFHGVDRERREALLEEQTLAAEGISPDTLRDLYETLYEDRALENGPPDVRLLPARELVDVQAGAAARLGADNLLTGERERYEADVVVLCTGYGYQVPAFLDPIRDRLAPAEGQPYDLTERFRVRWTGPEDLDLYAVNAGRFSHGVADPQLSLAAWRSATVINDLLDREALDVPETMDLVDWTDPDAGATDGPPPLHRRVPDPRPSP